MYLRLLPLIGVCLFALLPIRESFWVDELHSVWVVNGDWSELVSRAVEGNQSPLYFLVLKAWYSIFGFFLPSHQGEELLLRGFSYCGWVSLLAGIYYVLFVEWEKAAQTDETRIRSLKSVLFSTESLSNFHRIHSKHPSYVIAVLFITISIMLDRLGMFYAIELRPYGWAAFACLMMIVSSSRSFELNRFRFVWVLSATIAFYLHYTTILVILANMISIEVGVMYQIPKTNRKGVSQVLRLRFFEWIVFLILIMPGMAHLIRISSHSEQWAGFAGDTSIYNVLTILPWSVVVLLPLSVYAYYSLINRRTISKSPLFTQSMVTLVGTILIGWTITAMELAPLMHPRYMFGAYPAIWIVGGLAISKMRSSLAMVTALLCIGLLGWTQGTWSEWQEGRFVVWRGEDWRGAVDWLNNQKPENASIALSPMWIETSGNSVPSHLNLEYLSSPISTIYSIPEKSLLCILPNEISGWKAAINASLAEDNTSYHRGPLWILARIDSRRAQEAVTAMNVDRAELSADSDPISDWSCSVEYNGDKVQILKLSSKKSY